eukprot:gene13299-12129_t
MSFFKRFSKKHLTVSSSSSETKVTGTDQIDEGSKWRGTFQLNFGTDNFDTKSKTYEVCMIITDRDEDLFSGNL